MDFHVREETWRSQLNDFFRHDGGADARSGEVSLREEVAKYKGLIHKRTKIWWNRAFLERYLQQGLIPRGLRVQVFPSFDIDDNTFKDKWEDFANNCSKGFIQLLCDLNSSQLRAIETETVDLQNRIVAGLSTEAFKTFEMDIESDMSRWEKEVKDSKIKKFHRDELDLQSNRVYKWRMSTDRSRPFRRFNQNRSRSRSTSIRSFTSGEESSTEAYDPSTSGNRMPIPQRRYKKKQADTPRPPTDPPMTRQQHKNALQP
ncbi:uncharacterized protein ACNLHF_000279 [Anomaloglossus baeobatrachus]